ncbi:MAG: outer membrane beta-barrel protein [Gemmatimonadota bacterium]|nr:outer membrane beta-barrel protein [Gemmatimonadota bacterium]
MSTPPVRLAAALCALGAFVLPAHLVGQSSTTRGLSLGFALEGASLSVEGGDPSGGGGAGLRVGYGFNRIVTVFFGVDGNAIDVQDEDAPNGDWKMAHVDLGARFHFANTLRSWVPYLEAALTARAVSLADAVVGNQTVGDLSFNGGAFTAGGGIAFYFSEAVALDVELLVSAGEFTSISVDAGTLNIPDIDAASSRLRLGLNWWP